MRWIRENSLYFAWLITLAGSILSLYTSQVLAQEPCTLCWLQRCALFPLAILLGIAAYRDDREFFRYGIVLSAIGFLIAVLQVFFSANICSSGCSESGAVLGPITLPMLGVAGFALISLLLAAAAPKR